MKQGLGGSPVAAVRVMVVDDDAVLHDCYRRILGGAGDVSFRLFHAERGADAVAEAKRAAMTKSLAGYVALPEVADADTYVVPPALGGNAGPLGAIVLGAQALDEQLHAAFTTH